MDADFGDEEGEELYQDQSIYMVFFFFLWDIFDTFIFNTRIPLVDLQHMDWAEHRDRQIRRDTFRQMYQMEIDAFNALVELLRDAHTVDEHMANIRSVAGVIVPETRLHHCLIRFIAGGSYLDIFAMVNIHHTTFYKSVWATCEAINACNKNALGFCLPETLPELQRASEGFQSMSTQGVIRGCTVETIDGWLCPIIVPPRAVFGNIGLYFLGHYYQCCYGINVQAVIDHLCHFIYIAVAAPGSQPDIKAIARTKNLPNVLTALPLVGLFNITENSRRNLKTPIKNRTPTSTGPPLCPNILCAYLWRG
jgi:hypothetical protein